MFTGLLESFSRHTSLVASARGALRRLRPMTLDAEARAHVENLKTANEVFRRSPAAHHAKVLREVRDEITSARRQAAAVALHGLGQVRSFAEQTREAVTTARRNTALTFPDALDGLSADGMATFELLRLQIRDRLSSASAAQLLNTYRAALTRRDLRGLIEASAIEEMADGGTVAAATQDDVPLLKELREHVAGVQDLRVPSNLPDLDGLTRDVDRLEARAKLLGIAPIDPATNAAAARAFEQERPETEKAGAADDATDFEIVRSELAGA
jgi:hypothetical protein